MVVVVEAEVVDPQAARATTETVKTVPTMRHLTCLTAWEYTSPSSHGNAAKGYLHPGAPDARLVASIPSPLEERKVRARVPNAYRRSSLVSGGDSLVDEQNVHGMMANRLLPRCLGALTPLLTVLLATVVLGGCSTSTSPVADPLGTIPTPARSGQPAVTVGQEATKGPIRASASSDRVHLDVLQGLLGDEPIFNGDFADPSALSFSSGLYLYASSTQPGAGKRGAHIPAISLSRSSGFAGEYIGDVLPKVPSWTVPGFQWAPSVWARPGGTYVLYYSTPATNPIHCMAEPRSQYCVSTTLQGWTNAQCISRATSSSPAGPFVDDSSAPFICPIRQGGAIDPSVVIDDRGTPWLLWKSDGNCCDKATSISIQPLTSDGLSVAGPARRLIGATQKWEGGLVEGPSMVKEGSTYWLFYSANQWGFADYAIGIAKCASISGPCTKPLDHAWVRGGDGTPVQGPGGQEFYQTGPLVWMVNHALAPGQEGNSAQRRLYVHLLTFPAGQLPRLATGVPAAAVAQAIVYYGDTSLPADPKDAFVALVKRSPDGAADLDRATLLALGDQTCAALAAGSTAQQIVDSLAKDPLSAFDVYVAIVAGTEYLCPNMTAQALKVIGSALDS